MKLFKYTKIEYALDIIQNKRLYLNNPERFNDPFDCLLDSDEIASRKASSLIVNYFQFKDLYNFALNNFDSIIKNKDSARKILTYGNNLKKVLKLNPFYKRWNYIDEINNKFGNATTKKEANISASNYYLTIKNTMKSIRNNSLVYCFSKTNKSILLWSHYADSHKGVCVEFEVEPTEKDMVEVIYSSEISKFDIVSVTSKILALDFLNVRFNPSDDDFNKKIMKPYYTKALDWKYEEEVRYVLSKNSTERVFKIKDNYYINSPKIVSVTFGCKIDKTDSNYQKLKAIAKAQNIIIKYVTPNNNEFVLDETIDC